MDAKRAYEVSDGLSLGGIVGIFAGVADPSAGNTPNAVDGDRYYKSDGTVWRLTSGTWEQDGFSFNSSPTFSNVGIGTTSPGYDLDVVGNIRVANGTDVYIQKSGFGYDSAYEAVQLGYLAGSTDSVAVALGIDPNTVSGSAFTGNEIVLPNTAKFIQANNGKTDWIVNVLTFNNGNVGIGTGTTSPSRRFVVSGSGNAALISTSIATAPTEASGPGQALTVHAGIATAVSPIFTAHSNVGSNGAEKFRIQADGNVGIGTTSPGEKVVIDGGSANTKLVINCVEGYSPAIVLTGGGTNEYLIYNYAGSGDLRFATGGAFTDRVTFTATGNVGIGTTNPTKLFQVGTGFGVSANGDVGIGRVASGAKLEIYSINDTSDENSLTLYNMNNNNGGIYPSSIKFKSHVGYSKAAGIRGIPRDNLSTTMDLEFFTSGSSNGTKMAITTTGNVGIGTTSPAAKLDVNNTANTLAMRVDRPSTTAGDSIAEFYSDVTTANTVKCTIYSNGDVKNSTGVFSSYSDVKLKENIENTSDKLQKLLQVGVRNFTLIGDPDFKLLGVIAQELEGIFPGLVTSHPDYETVPDPDWVPPVPEYRTQQVTVIEEVEEEYDVLNEIDGEWVQQTKTRTVEVKELKTELKQVRVIGRDGVETFKEMQVPCMEQVLVTPICNSHEPPTIRRPTGTSTKSVKYSIFIPILIKAVQEMYAELQDLKVQL